jgi:hypothetical protein
MVLPAELSSTISSTSHCWVRGSSAAVGSSKRSTSGFMTSQGEQGDIEPEEDRRVADEGGSHQHGEHRHQLHPGVDPLEQPRARGDVAAEERLAHHRGRPTERFLDEAALPPLADAPARAQADFPLQQPARGAGGGRLAGGGQRRRGRQVRRRQGRRGQRFRRPPWPFGASPPAASPGGRTRTPRAAPPRSPPSRRTPRSGTPPSGGRPWRSRSRSAGRGARSRCSGPVRPGSRTGGRRG